MGLRLREGDKAPDFTLEAQNGRMVSLHDYAGKRNVVLYFYVKDFTVGCTAETKKFGEEYEEALSMNAEVIGISSDSSQSHGGFASDCGVEFPLLSDGGNKVRESYGVSPSLGFIPGRVTFVIDKQGVVQRVFSSQINPRRHVSEALQTLRELPN